MIRSKLKSAAKKVVAKVQGILAEEPGVPEPEVVKPASPEAVLNEAVAETAPNANAPGLPHLSLDVRHLAWTVFLDGVRTWVDGFEVEGVPQPDRLGVIKGWGEGRFTVAILVMAHEVMGLQKLVRRALIELRHPSANDLDYIERVSANMIQVCHMGFPDLMSTYDYSTAWRRN